MNLKTIFTNPRLLLAIVLAGILFLMIFMIVYIASSPNQSTTPPNTYSEPTRTQERSNNTPPLSTSDLQKAVVGKTNSSEVEQMSGLIKKETLVDGSIKYSFQSEINVRPSDIITKNGVVVFERGLTPQSPNAKGYGLVSEYKKRLGEPERIIVGSKFYGRLMTTYIYASKGTAFIGNSYTDEVLEVHTFLPMSVELYISNYGDDIDFNPSEH